MKPAKPSFPRYPASSGVIQVTGTYLTHLLDCLKYAMNNPYGDGITIKNDPGGQLRAVVRASAAGGGAGAEETIGSNLALGVSADGTKLRIYSPYSILSTSYSLVRVTYSVSFFYNNAHRSVSKCAHVRPEPFEWTPKGAAGNIWLAGKILRTDAQVSFVVVIADTGGGAGAVLPVIDVAPHTILLGTYQVAAGKVSVTQANNEFIPHLVLADSENPISDKDNMISAANIVWHN